MNHSKIDAAAPAVYTCHLPEALNLRKIAESGQCFRWVEANDGYLIPHRGHLLFVRQPDPFTLEMDCAEDEFEAVWKDYFDLNTSYDAICARISMDRDPFLCDAIADQQGIRILRQDAWEMLITSIITQNRNIPAIRKSVELLCEKCSAGCSWPKDVRPFPSPQQLDQLPDEALAKCRLGYRMKYIRAAAHAVASGELNLQELEDLPDDEAMKRLTALYGVGAKVASCVLLFGLHRLNAFPTDVWIRRVMADKYPCGYPFEAYAPYNGVYQQYMFEYYRKTQG